MYYTMTTQTLSFILEGGEQVAALRAKISVAREDILSVEWHESFKKWPDWHMRMPGSYLPRWIMAGSYWSEPGWDFVYAKNPRGMIHPLLLNVLVVTTKQDKYRRIILQTPKDNFKEIQAWFKEK